MLLATSLAFLVEPGRFRIVDSESTASFGGNASITLESLTMKIQLVRDRREISCRFQSIGSEEWFWIGVARRLLIGDRPGSDDLDESAVEFLESSLGVLEEDLGDEAKRERLLVKLVEARDDRAREVFG